MATPPGVTVDHLTRNYTKANRTAADIVWVVVHDMEMAEKPDTAEGCRDYFQTTATQASSHYTIDNNSIVECVAVEDVAWCAPGANAIGIHLEHAGFARQTTGEWLDPYGVAMLSRSAALTAFLCETYRVPKRRLTTAEIQARKSGIVGHGDLTKAGVGGNTHTDPGPNFPWTYYIDLVNQQEEDMPTAAEIATEVWTRPVNGPDGAKVTAGQAVQDTATWAYRASRDAAAALATAQALGAAVEALSKAAGVDPAEIAAIVDKAVRDRLAKLAVVDNNQAGA